LGVETAWISSGKTVALTTHRTVIKEKSSYFRRSPLTPEGF
jgi:hypothetical protein